MSTPLDDFIARALPIIRDAQRNHAKHREPALLLVAPALFKKIFPDAKPDADIRVLGARVVYWPTLSGERIVVSLK